MFVLSLDIFQTPMWQDIQDSIPPRLLSIAENVKQTVFASKADGTIRTYLGGFNNWRRWAKSNGLNYLPANPFHVSMYLQGILQSSVVNRRSRRGSCLQYRLVPWVSWFSQSVLSLFGPLHDVCIH